MVRTTNAVRERHRADAWAKRMCEYDGCGHPIVQHFEADRDSAQYRPLRFFCRTDGCGCFRDATP